MQSSVLCGADQGGSGDGRQADGGQRTVTPGSCKGRRGPPRNGQSSSDGESVPNSITRCIDALSVGRLVPPGCERLSAMPVGV